MGDPEVILIDQGIEKHKYLIEGEYFWLVYNKKKNLESYFKDQEDQLRREQQEQEYLNRLQQLQQYEQALEHQRRMNALQNLSNSLNNANNIMHKAFYGDKKTCSSRPNIFGGFDTICD